MGSAQSTHLADASHVIQKTSLPISEVMAGPLTRSMDLKDIACTGGNEFILGERKKDIDCTLGNDSGLGEEVFPAEDIVAAFGPKLMFRYKFFG